MTATYFLIISVVGESSEIEREKSNGESKDPINNVSNACPTQFDPGDALPPG